MGVFFGVVMLTLYIFFSTISIGFNSIIGNAFSSGLIGNKIENVLDQDLFMKNVTTQTELDTFFPKCFANISIKTRDGQLEGIKKVEGRCMEGNQGRGYRVFFFTDKSFKDKTTYYDTQGNLKDNGYLYEVNTVFDTSNIIGGVHQYTDKRTFQTIDSQGMIFVGNEMFPNRVLPTTL